MGSQAPLRKGEVVVERCEETGTEAGGGGEEKYRGWAQKHHQELSRDMFEDNEASTTGTKPPRF